MRSITMFTETFPKRVRSLPEGWRAMGHVDEDRGEILGWTAIHFVLNYESELFNCKWACRRFILDQYKWLEGNVQSLNQKS